MDKLDSILKGLFRKVNDCSTLGYEEKFIFTDKISGAKAERPGLNQCLEMLSTGDTLIVWRLDRLRRSEKMKEKRELPLLEGREKARVNQIQ